MAVRRVEIVITAQDRNAGKIMAALQAQADKLAATEIHIPISIDGSAEALAALQAINTEIDDIKAKGGDLGNLHVNSGEVEAQLAIIRAQLGSLQDAANNIDVKMDDAGALARLAALKAAIAAVHGQTLDENISPGDLGLLANRIMAISYATRNLDSETKNLGQDAANAFTPWFNFLGKVSLFGGALHTGAWHLWLDSFVELAAILGPATIALVAFGAALAGTAPTLETIYNREQNLYTATDLLNKGLPGLGHSLTNMQASIRPGVFAVLGDAFDVISSKTGIFAHMMQEAVSWVDNFAARITVDLKNSGGAFSNLINDGKRVLGILGNIFDTLGNALMNLFKVAETTHIAEDLLLIADGLAHIVDWITKLPTPLLAAIVGLHGLYLWGGLLSTGLINLSRSFVTLLSKAGVFKAITALWPEAGTGIQNFLGKMNLIKPAASDAGSAVTIMTDDMGNVTTKSEEAGEETGFFSKALGFVTSPAGLATLAIGAMAIGLGYLIYHFATATTAAQRWASKMNASIDKANNAQQFNMMAQDVGKLDKAYAAATKQQGTYMSRWGPELTAAGLRANQLGAQINHVTGQMHNFGDNVLWIESKFGVNYSEALAIATQAGVKLNDSMTNGSKAAQILQQKVTGLMTGFTQLQTPAGLAGKDFEALAYSSNDITQKISQLNSAWDQWESSVTGSQSAFDTFAQGLTTMKSKSDTLTLSLGKLQDQTTFGKAKIDSLTNSGIALNQAFTQETGNLGSWADAMRSSGMAADGATGANKQLISGMKAGVAALLPYAAGSKEATSQLYALAQQANYTGGDSIASMAKWAGISAPQALAIMKHASDQATTAASNLANTISNLLNVQFDQDIVKASGASQALAKYTQDLVNNTADTQSGHNARAALIGDLEKAGLNAHQAKNYVDGLNTSLNETGRLHEHPSVIVTAQGKVSISGLTKGEIKMAEHVPGGYARGGFIHEGVGYVRSGTTHTADDVFARVSKGELIVPHELVKAGYVDHLKGVIPGFAGGGIAGFANYSGNVPGASTWTPEANQAIGSLATKTAAGLAHNVIVAMNKAMPKINLPAGSVHGSAAAWIIEALKITHKPLSWLGALERLVSMESGGNPHAVDPIPVAGGQHAEGLFQTIPSTFAAYSLGGNIFNPVADAIAGIRYIASRYGSPANIPGLLSGHYSGYWNEGWIKEPVLGVGMRSGSTYGIAEHGPEYVSHGGGGNIYVTVNASKLVNPQSMAQDIWQELRRLKTQKRQSLGLD